jgi:hypothetical protein
MLNQPMTPIFPKSVPEKPTLDQLTEYVKYMKEHTEIAIANQRKEIQALEKRVKELEG